MSGAIGKYFVHLTIVPGDQAQFGNTVTVKQGIGRSQTSANGGREVTLYANESNGATIEKAMLHEFMHLLGNAPPYDHYYSSGEATPGWEESIMGNVRTGGVQQINIAEMINEAYKAFGCRGCDPKTKRDWQKYN
jgi:hypothetical protein